MKTTKTPKTTKSAKSTKPAVKFVHPMRISPRRVLKMSAIGLLVIFVAAQLAFDLAILRRGNNDNNTTVTQLISLAAEGIHKPAAVDPRADEVYLTDAKLVLPATQPPNDQLLYNYSSFDGKAELQVTTHQALVVAQSRLWSAQNSGSILTGSDPTAMFEKVPQLQACSRGIRVVFDAQDAASYGAKPENTKQLNDGRTMYLITDDVTTCGDSLSTLADYLKQAESY